ncbi:hypothetical protein [Streptomyces sp. NPDC093260]|uniref:hypothetical protein n=1 Tax=Streptomyces sp. NPDC093260 TaxID=3155073 RepID=UPI0034427364
MAGHPLGYLGTARAAHVRDTRAVLLACAALIVVTAVSDLCVPDVHRVRRVGPVDRVTGNDGSQVRS